MPRGNTRGRGRGNFKMISRTERESALDRLGKVVYPSKALNDKKYKFVRSTTVGSCVVTLPSENRIKILAKRFLKSYYDIFDLPGRLNLETQYSSDAFFSFSSTYPMPTVGRNLLEVRDTSQRLSMLVHDKTNIAKALATFSPTEHITHNLSVDVPFFIANPMSIISMQLVVTGIFRDTSQQTNQLRAFTRVFVIKHTSMDKQGEPVYQICNDIFMLQVPTPDQIKKYHQEVQAMKKTVGYTQQNKPNTSSSGLVSRTHEDMIKYIMEKTKMNRAGSEQLLIESNWNEDESMKTFNKLYSMNQIPHTFFTP